MFNKLIYLKLEGMAMEENVFSSRKELDEIKELKIKNGTYNFKNESICPGCNKHDIFTKSIVVGPVGEKREFLYCHYCHTFYVYKSGFLGRTEKPFLKANLVDIAGFANLMHDVTEDIQQSTYKDILRYGLQLPDPFPDFLLNNRILIEDEYGLKTCYNEYFHSGVSMTGVYGKERDNINRSYRIKQKVKNKEIPIVTEQDKMRLNEHMPWKKFL